MEAAVCAEANNVPRTANSLVWLKYKESRVMKLIRQTGAEAQRALHAALTTLGVC